MLQRRLARLIIAAALAAAAAMGAVGCGGAKAGDGVTSPPSTSGT